MPFHTQGIAKAAVPQDPAPSALGCRLCLWCERFPASHPQQGVAGPFPAFINAAVLVHEAKGSYREAGTPSAAGADGHTDRPPVLFCMP